MKTSARGAISGCIVGLLVFVVLGMCLIPVAFVVGGITSGSPLAARTLAPLLCPQGTSGTMYSYPTTSIDDSGVSVPATAYELHCVDAGGATIKSDPVLYAFLWEGIVVALAAIITALLALLLAAPAGVVAGKLLRKTARSSG